MVTRLWQHFMTADRVGMHGPNAIFLSPPNETPDKNYLYRPREYVTLAPVLLQSPYT